MKNKFKIASLLGIVALGIGWLCFTSTSSALQNQYPPLRTGANADVKPAPAKKAATAALSEKDKAFMMKAAKGGMEEVQMGDYARQHGQTNEVRNFGKRMVTEHTMANNELIQLAQGKGVTLPKQKPKMEKFSETNFDKQYMADMVKDHQKDLAEFQSEARNGSDPDLKKWAAKTSTMVQLHLNSAREIQSKLK